MDCLDVFLQDPETEGMICEDNHYTLSFSLTTMFTVKSVPTLLLLLFVSDISEGRSDEHLYFLLHYQYSVVIMFQFTCSLVTNL